MAEDAPEMRGERSRNQNGLLRDKRDDTHMGTTMTGRINATGQRAAGRSSISIIEQGVPEGAG